MCLIHDALNFDLFSSTRVTAFGDNLNIINVSGIVVVFLGVVLYKVSLHLSKPEKENLDIENNSHFSRISSSDFSDEFVYEDECSGSQRQKRSRSDPDIALTFKIDDDDIDEDVLINTDGSPLRERVNGSPLELDQREEESPAMIT